MSNIERELRDMTEWTDASPEAWREALRRADEEPPAANSWSRRINVPPWLGVAAVLAIVGAIGLVSLPTLSPSRSSISVGQAPSLAVPERSIAYGLDRAKEPGIMAELQAELDMDAGFANKTGAQAHQPERAVVRKATIEIEVDDVHSTSLKIRQLISEARSEFIETADVDATAKRPRANIVLRVDATRLEEVISAVRELGLVISEKIDAEDVTNQIVDVDARLSNERRVEQELLELLKSRTDDKLEDILSLRREINQVRERIERLDAQRTGLARLVSLAKIAIIVSQTEQEPEEEPRQAGLWSLIADNFGQAWNDGLYALGATAAWLVMVLVGGAPWIVIGVILATLVLRKSQQSRPLPV